MWNLLQADPDHRYLPGDEDGRDRRCWQSCSGISPAGLRADRYERPWRRMFERRYNLGEAVFRTATGERGTLPTETWREYVERRSRCLARCAINWLRAR